MKTGRVCELCDGEASLYCESDSAFLCWSCDARVHEANFLVARHVRRTVCFKCEGFDGNRISGVGFRPRRPICRSCSSEDLDDSSSSSACISAAVSVTTAGPKTKLNGFNRRRQRKIACSSSVSDVSGDESSSPVNITGEVSSRQKKRSFVRRRIKAKVDVKAEVILRNWCRKLGLKNSHCIALASHALSVCLREIQFAALPSRVSVVSSLWVAWKASEGRSVSTCQNLKRLEEISGVPAKLILMAESKIVRVLKINNSRAPLNKEEEEEGWAECSN